MDRYQLAAARGMLGWSQKHLSELTQITVEAINKIERGEVANPRQSTVKAIRQCFEDAGIEFIEQSGVRRRSESINIKYGTDALEELFNKIYQEAVQSPQDTEFLCSGYSSKEYMAFLPESISKSYVSRMTELNRVHFKTLIPETEDDGTLKKFSYSEYKKLPEKYFFSTPFYVFSDNIAFIVWSPLIQVICIKNKNVAEVYRRQFEAMWDMAVTLTGRDS